MVWWSWAVIAWALAASAAVVYLGYALTIRVELLHRLMPVDNGQDAALKPYEAADPKQSSSPRLATGRWSGVVRRRLPAAGR